jgi:hypothetical protein
LKIMAKLFRRDLGAANAAPATVSLQDRIAALHDEIDQLVAARVQEIASFTPGVPLGVIEQTVFSRAGGCRCAMARLLPQGDE